MHKDQRSFESIVYVLVVFIRYAFSSDLFFTQFQIVKPKTNFGFNSVLVHLKVSLTIVCMIQEVA